MKTLRYAHSFEVAPTLLPELEPLQRLARNLRWCWDEDTTRLFQDIADTDWDEVEHNPVRLLTVLDEARQASLASDQLLLNRINEAARSLDEYLAAQNWFDQFYPGRRGQTLIAYFCAEFGLHESLPIYSGGLGVLAGDHLKAASDLGIPLVGVGLLYQRGNFRQSLTPDGWQQERYPNSDFYNLPIELVRGSDDEPIRVAVELSDRTVACQIWKAVVGRIDLYLLDSNLLENEPNDQAITDTLYGGDEEMRMRQEIILGIGGFKALRALGLTPSVCHMNEGHAAFLTLERLRAFMADHGCDFRTARQCVVSGNVFTTHTPVPAGFDIFTRDMLAKYLAKTVAELGISFDQFLAYGRIHPEQDEAFNMAVLAMSNSNHVNGVSRLHARVTREMFSDRWPDFPVYEVPIEAVTNGIHTPTWIGSHVSNLLDRHVGRDWRNTPSSSAMWQKFAGAVPAQELWEARQDARSYFVGFVHGRCKRCRAVDTRQLDPNILTIGFARRFATYKRATLLFQDRERLKRLLRHESRPIQFVFAGKAHPRDDGGKRLIQDIKRFIDQEGLSDRMVFLEDYDIGIARELVKGVDVWLNNPRRPQEASGTSGMKVVGNGGLNCSILDGWWAEGYRPDAGWAIGDEYSSSDEGYQDWLDSQALYSLLENDIAPRFYRRNEDGVPDDWVAMMRTSMSVLTPEFSTDRMVRDYAERCYMPASEQFLRLTADGQIRAKSAQEWRARVQANWKNVAICEVHHSLAARSSVGTTGMTRATVDLAGLEPEDVSVDLLIGVVGSNREIQSPRRLPMRLVERHEHRCVFETEVTLTEAGHHGSVVRVTPNHDDVRTATELPLVVWETTI